MCGEAAPLTIKVGSPTPAITAETSECTGFVEATTLGAAILQYDVPPGFWKDLRDTLTEASWVEFRRFAKVLAPLLWAFALGSLIGAVLLAGAAYRAALGMVVAHRRRLSMQKHEETPE